MADRLSQRPPLLDLVGLRNPTPDQRLSLKYNPQFITAYHVYKCYPDETTGLLFSLMEPAYKGITDLGLAPTDFDGIDALASSITAQEADEAYETVASTLIEESREPEHDMYTLLKKAYVKVLKIGDEKAKLASFVRKHILPYAGTDDFLDASTVKRLLSIVPEDERGQITARQQRGLKAGIQRHELEVPLSELHRADNARRALHQEILQYGRALDYSEDDVTAQIFFEYAGLDNSLSIKLDRKNQRAVLTGGVLMIKARDPDNWYGLPEFRYDEYDPSSDESRKRYEEKKGKSEAVVQQYLRGEEVSQPRYTSRLRYSGTEQDDKQLFDQLNAIFPDLPMERVYEVYLCMHNDICTSHELRIDLRGIYNKPEALEQQFLALRKALSDLGISLH